MKVKSPENNEGIEVEKTRLNKTQSLRKVSTSNMRAGENHIEGQEPPKKHGRHNEK